MSREKPSTSTKRREVGLATLKASVDHGRGRVDCSCGWIGWHHRAKVLQAKAERHVDARHGGRSIWL